MSVISKTNYLSLQADLASARDTILSAKDDLFDAVYTVVMLQVVIPEVDLLNSFWNTYQGNVGTLESYTNLIDSVRSLQQHIITRSTYSTVNEYLYNVIMPDQVEYSFKVMSDSAGFAINASYAYTS